MTRRLRLGVVGLSRAFVLMRPALAWHPRVSLVACADPRPEARARFAQEFPGTRGYADAAALLDDPAVEAVYVATPHGRHAADTIAACAAGRHVLVEKPMAVTLAEAGAMVEAAARAGVRLMVGHSHAQDGPVALARRLIAGGGFGPLRLVTALACTDFLLRPRRPEELVTAEGGGVVFSQAAHQVDVVRRLGGGRLASVRAQTFAWDPARPTEGAYAALLLFADGAAASLTYSGHGNYDSDALLGWIGELGTPRAPGPAPRPAPAAEEAEAKRRRAYGPETPALGPPGPPAFHNQFGFVLACCPGADLRLTAEGVEVHAAGGMVLERAPLPAVPRGEVLDVFAAAVLDGAPPVHDGAWGLATLEACLALLASAREGREVALRHQVAGP